MSGCSSELDRPENKDLKEYVGRLTKAKAVLDTEGAAFGEPEMQILKFELKPEMK